MSLAVRGNHAEKMLSFIEYKHQPGLLHDLQWIGPRGGARDARRQAVLRLIETEVGANSVLFGPRFQFYLLDRFDRHERSNIDSGEVGSAVRHARNRLQLKALYPPDVVAIAGVPATVIVTLRALLPAVPYPSAVSW